MEDPSGPLEMAGNLLRWGIAIAAGLIVFLIWRWLAGPSLHWVETLIGCFLFAAVGLAVRRAVERLGF